MNTKNINIISISFLIFQLVILLSCSSNDPDSDEIIILDNFENNDNNSGYTNNGSSEENNQNIIKLLALGDSYTIGTSVCALCNFPNQLTTKLQEALNKNLKLDIIAQSGWTTTALHTAIDNQSPSNDYDLVTLLIGVNNQNQQKPLDLYIIEFPALLDKAIQFAKGNSKHVIVISIPDYVYTPYGQDLFDPDRISNEIDAYNAFAKRIAENKNVKFLDITDITRNGLNDPSLVASDGLHPSENAYAEFVERLLPICLEIIND